jgi:predicted MPP superfamily phosphohydrolase
MGVFIMLDLLQNLMSSQKERFVSRTLCPKSQSILNKPFYWKPLDMDVDWAIEQNKIYHKIIRLVEKNKNIFVGWGLDKNFIIKELLPLYSTKTGFVNIAANDSLNKKFRFAHLSDLHICWKNQKTMENDTISDDTLADLRESLNNQDLDFITVTGDITDNGLGYMKFYNAFKEWILKGKVLVVPGNHDIKRLGLTPISAQFKNQDYAEFSRITMGSMYTNNYIVNCANLMIIGLDSSGFRNNFNIIDNAVGCIDEEALEEISDKVRQIDYFYPGRFKILMLHHPLQLPKADEIEYGTPSSSKISKLRKLSNADAVLDFCKSNKIDLVLHGHEHLSYNINSEALPELKLISSPSVTESRSYHIVEVDTKAAMSDRIIRRCIKF